MRLKFLRGDILHPCLCLALAFAAHEQYCLFGTWKIANQNWTWFICSENKFVVEISWYCAVSKCKWGNGSSLCILLTMLRTPLVERRMCCEKHCKSSSLLWLYYFCTGEHLDVQALTCEYIGRSAVERWLEFSSCQYCLQVQTIVHSAHEWQFFNSSWAWLPYQLIQYQCCAFNSFTLFK